MWGFTEAHIVRGTLLQLILNICFIVAGIILIPLLFQFLPEGRWHEGTIQHTYFRYFWWFCGLVMFIWSWKYDLLKTNIIGAIFTVCMGPVTLLTLGFFKLYLLLRKVDTASTSAS